MPNRSLVAWLFLALCLGSLVQCKKERGEAGKGPEGEKRGSAEVAAKRGLPGDSKSAEESTVGAVSASREQRRQLQERLADREDALQTVMAGWAGISGSGLFGNDLIEAKREWASDALAKLGGSKELMQFLEFLKKRGEGDLRDWLIDEGMAEAFAGEKGAEMRQWLRSLGPEDKKLAVRIGFSAGEGLLGDEGGLKNYLGAFTDVNIQSEILSGYCSVFALEHPEEAVSKFMELRPGAMDTSGVTLVMGSLPPETDFAAAGSGIPDDGKTLAKRARRAMLENWAGVDAAKAANYVMGNTKTVHADQLGVVMERWLADDEQAALGWMENLGVGEHRDHAYIAEARVFSKTDVARAWETAEKVEDLDRRIEAATPVYQAWAGRDPQGAKLAWELMFGK